MNSSEFVAVLFREEKNWKFIDVDVEIEILGGEGYLISGGG